MKSLEDHLPITVVSPVDDPVFLQESIKLLVVRRLINFIWHQLRSWLTITTSHLIALSLEEQKLPFALAWRGRHSRGIATLLVHFCQTPRLLILLILVLDSALGEDRGHRLLLLAEIQMGLAVVEPRKDPHVLVVDLVLFLLSQVLQAFFHDFAEVLQVVLILSAHVLLRVVVDLAAEPRLAVRYVPDSDPALKLLQVQAPIVVEFGLAGTGKFELLELFGTAVSVLAWRLLLLVWGFGIQALGVNEFVLAVAADQRHQLGCCSSFLESLEGVSVHRGRGFLKNHLPLAFKGIVVLHVKLRWIENGRLLLVLQVVGVHILVGRLLIIDV